MLCAFTRCALPPRPLSAGVVTNLLAGLMGSRWGIKWTLLTGLSLPAAGGHQRAVRVAP
jgi:hypothetical protein